MDSRPVRNGTKGRREFCDWRKAEEAAMAVFYKIYIVFFVCAVYFCLIIKHV